MFDLLTIIGYHENGFESSDPQPPQLKNSHQIRDYREAVSGETWAGSSGRLTEEIVEGFDKARMHRVIRE
jgi:hypothetical protein